MIKTLHAALAVGLVVATAASAIAETALPVQIATVTTRSLPREHVLIGSIEAQNSYPAGFRTGGRIVEIAVEVGDLVARGELIARVDPAQANASLSAAEASLAAAEAALVQAEQARDRAANLVERGVGTQSTLDEAEEALTSAISSRDQASAQLARARQAVEDTEIRAIEDVIVIERLADVGEVATAGTAVVTLASQGKREAVFYAPDVGGLSSFVGHSFTVSPRDSDEEFKARVREVSPVLTDSGTVEVRAEIPDELAEAMVIGASVTGSVTIASMPIMRVPWNALTATADGPAVWLVDPETMRVSLSSVEVGAYADVFVAVIGGLEEGDLVVGAGSQFMYEGRLVEAGEGSE
ncbi:efflux RND transporter periplasmic adaptor subunit [Psychromarinibacter sp. S121]|uniref:efflux RND transporter periplasmic adaptor subunit n=1 Tax=Psychromarinibacter sp. S121 TaxID=3415127 RepID=UPI003C7C0665